MIRRFRIGILSIFILGILLLSSVGITQTAHGWIYPSDTGDRQYYPGSNYYPQEFYKVYSEKYTKVYTKDIVLSMSYGHQIKIGTLVFTITPLFLSSGDKSVTIDGKQKEFMIDVEIVYNAGSYPRDEPAIRYLDDDGNHHSWEMPKINAFYLEKTQLKADFSGYSYKNNWRIISSFGGTSASNWHGTWKLNGQINSDNNWDAYMSKSERAQFVAEGVTIESNLHDAYLKWKNNLINQVKDDANLLQKYNEYSSAMSSAGYLLNLISLGAGDLPGLGVAQGTLGIGQFIYSMYESEIVTDVVNKIGELDKWEWHSADTDGNYMDAVATYVYPEPSPKTKEVDVNDGTYDSYADYFWHYKNWTVASHLTYDLSINVNKMPSTTNPQTSVDVPLTFTVWFHYGPPGYYYSVPYTFTTTLKLAFTGHSNEPQYAPDSFGLPLPVVKDKSTGELISYGEGKIINKGELYEFYLHIPNSPVSKVNYYVDWDDGDYSEVKDANPTTNTYVSHVWWNQPAYHDSQAPHYLRLFAYYKNGDTVLLSQVFRMELIWQDNGNTPGGGCPFLYTYGKNGWQAENNVLVWAENATRPFLETGDYYLFNATENNGRITLGIGEPGEDTDYIDAVRLYKVYAPEGYKVAESYGGTVYAYRDVKSGIARDNQGRNVTGLLSKSDGNYWTGRKGSYVDVTLNMSTENLLVIRGIDNPPVEKKAMLRAELVSSVSNTPVTESTIWMYANISNGWVKLGELKVRHNMHTNVVNLDTLIPHFGNRIELRFEMRDFNGIDYIGIAHDYRLVPLERMKLEYASYGYTNISERDGNYLRINPGDFVRMNFEGDGNGLYLFAVYGFYFNHRMIGKGIGIAKASEVNIAEAELQNNIKVGESYVLLPLLQNYSGIMQIIWYVDGVYVFGEKPVVSFTQGTHTITLWVLRDDGTTESYSLNISAS